MSTEQQQQFDALQLRCSNVDMKISYTLKNRLEINYADGGESYGLYDFEMFVRRCNYFFNRNLK
jgi:hypothetical protein